MKVSLSYDQWSLRNWRIKIGKCLGFLRNKVYLTYPMQLGVLGRTSVEPITPGRSWRFSKIFRLERFLKLRKREVSDKFKSFCRFCLFSVDKPHQPGQTKASADVSGPLISVAEGFLTGH